MSTTTSHLLTLPDFLAADVSRPPSAAARFRLGDAAAAAATPADNNRAAGAYQSWNRGITIATLRALDATPIVSNISHNSLDPVDISARESSVSVATTAAPTMTAASAATAPPSVPPGPVASDNSTTAKLTTCVPSIWLQHVEEQASADSCAIHGKQSSLPCLDRPRTQASYQTGMLTSRPWVLWPVGLEDNVPGAMAAGIAPRNTTGLRSDIYS